MKTILEILLEMRTALDACRKVQCSAEVWERSSYMFDSAGCEPIPTRRLLAVDVLDAGIRALAQYDADQAAKRAAEIEAAYKEGLLDGISLTDSMTEDEYIESVTNAWAASDTKKSLEAK
jgi:hypothetical protein